jgi:hypothetical protein
MVYGLTATEAIQTASSSNSQIFESSVAIATLMV